MEGHKSEVGDKAREKCNHKSCSEPYIPSRQQQVTSNKSYTALSPNRRRKHQAPNWCLPWDHIHVRKEIIKEIGRQTGDQRPQHRDGSGRKVGFSGRQIMFSTLRTAQREKQTTNERQVGDTVKEIFGSQVLRKQEKEAVDKWETSSSKVKSAVPKNKITGTNLGSKWETRGNKWKARSYHPNDAPTNSTINCFWNRAAWHTGRQAGNKRKCKVA